MTKKIKLAYYLSLSVFVINLMVGFHVYSAVEKESGEANGYQVIRQFSSVLKLIRKNYVDDEKIGYEDLIYGAMQGMLTSLDRFSSYIKPDEYDKMREETEGEFGGIGIVISMKDDVLTVVAPMEDTPGMRAGLMANDKITKIDDNDTSNLTLDQAVNLIKGENGTTVTLTIYRPSTKETKTITIERGIIELTTVKDAHSIEPGIAYVRIVQFNEKTAASLEQELQIFSKGDLQGLIVDLRNNPGGLLTSAIDVSSLFIPRHKLIVFTEGRDESRKQDYKSGSGKKYLEVPVVILINEGSASAAEIVAGCLQDYGRSLVVGEKSFGKGSVQSIIELDDGSAVRLTTAKYYTPSRRVIHDHGIEPDFIVDISDEDARRLAIQRSRYKGEIINENELKEDLEDVQLTRALEVLKGYLTLSKGEKLDFAKVLKTKSSNSNDDSSPSQEK